MLNEALFTHPPKNYSNLTDAFNEYEVEVEGDDGIVTCPSCRNVFIVAHFKWKRTPRSITKPCPYCGVLAKPK